MNDHETVSKPQSISEMMEKRDGVTSKPLIKPMAEGGPYSQSPQWAGVPLLTLREIELRGIVAQGWCSKENSHKEMDPVLSAEIARLVYANEKMQLDPPQDQAMLRYATREMFKDEGAEAPITLECATTKEILYELAIRCQEGNLNDMCFDD